MPSRYAAGTDVPIGRTMQEIKALIREHGGNGVDVMDGERMAGVQFVMRERRVLFRVPLADPGERRFTHTPNNERPRSPDKVAREVDQANRSLWRGLLLLIRAKLEGVAAGVVVFEDEFLATTVAPDTGVTVAEALREPMREAYRIGHSRLLLPKPSRSTATDA